MPKPVEVKKIAEAIEKVVERQKDFLAHSPANPFPLGTAEGRFLFDGMGTKFLDFSCADGVMVLGHQFRAIHGAMQEFLRYHHVTTLVPGGHLYPPVIAYASALANSFARPDLKVTFALDEHTALAEAVHQARSLTYRNRTLVVAGDNLWYATDYPDRVDTIVEGNMLYGESWDVYAALVISLTDWEGRPYDRTWLTDIVAQASACGTRVIINESRTGFGRTFEHFWGQQFYGVQADYTVVGGPLGGGFPLGAVIAPEALTPAPSRVPPLSGDLVACRVGLAVLTEIDESLISEATKLALVLSDGLDSLVDEFPDVVERAWGVGLQQSLVMKDPDDAREFVQRCFQAGLYLSDPRGRSVYMTPALTSTAAEIQLGIDVMAGVLMAWADPSAGADGDQSAIV
ncbi:aminotransferase [Gordonia phage Skog]|uniref:Aminotransferase n=1 Tax=Gordonia phage Skog TaxID=2704033 RepID=A0A6G6XK02_9CAUD|nr:aminotransferase [Gordonia phage Skog]QIG58356.1 aminotransferase [Gordonia phage Skog]